MYFCRLVLGSGAEATARHKIKAGYRELGDFHGEVHEKAALGFDIRRKLLLAIGVAMAREH
jgi:hypothetical protein